MLTFLIIQEREDSLRILLSKLIQISITNPNNNVICSCSLEIFNTLKKCCPENINLIHFEININIKKIESSILNWINSLEFGLENYGEVLFLSEPTILTNKVPLTEELKLQKIAFLKLLDLESLPEQDDNIILNDKEVTKTSYSISICYISNQSVIDCIKQSFSDNTKLFEQNEDEDENEDDDEDENEDEETKKERKKKIIYEKIKINKQYVATYKNIPYLFSDVKNYITHKGFITTNDFFRLNNSHKEQDIFIKDEVIKHKEDVVWGMILDTTRPERSIQIINAHLTKLLVQYNILYLPTLNMIWQKEILKLIMPKKEGVYHWNRENSVFYNYIDNLCNNNKVISLSEKVANNSYFYISNYVLFDKSDVKYLTNELNKCFGILYLDYNNELLEAFNNIEKITIFLGYYCAYPNILESFIDPQDVKRMGTKILKEGEYNSEEEFELYLDDLATFKYFTVDKNTPKNRIAECLRVGVVPRLLDDTKLLEIEDIAKDKDTKWEILSEKCREYYSNNISLDIITSKIFKVIFNM